MLRETKDCNIAYLPPNNSPIKTNNGGRNEIYKSPGSKPGREQVQLGFTFFPSWVLTGFCFVRCVDLTKVSVFLAEPMAKVQPSCC